MHRSFAIGTLLRKPRARTTPMDRLLILWAFLLCTHVHLVTQESQLCSCLQKCKWNANRYHNNVHCTYCKHRTKRRISGIESPLHSCWDKITVKKKEREVPWRERGGFRNPWNPPLATLLNVLINLPYNSTGAQNNKLIPTSYLFTFSFLRSTIVADELTMQVVLFFFEPLIVKGS